jgi:hypothetical protein
MAYINDPNGKKFDGYPVARIECYGVRLASDYKGDVPPEMLLVDVLEAEYVVFEHGPFDYEQSNCSVEEKVDTAIANFNFADTEYRFDDTLGRIAYLYHDPVRFRKYIRPVRKQ